MNCSKCPNQLHEKVTLGSVHLPKSWAGYLPFVKRFQVVMVYKLGLSLGVPLDTIYYVRNSFGNFPGTLPWSLQLWTSAFLALRIVQPHLLPLPIRICSRPLVIQSLLPSACNVQIVTGKLVYFANLFPQVPGKVGGIRWCDWNWRRTEHQVYR